VIDANFKNFTTFSLDANAPVPTHEKHACKSTSEVQIKELI
jgi:hypothetical protein